MYLDHQTQRTQGRREMASAFFFGAAAAALAYWLVMVVDAIKS